MKNRIISAFIFSIMAFAACAQVVKPGRIEKSAVAGQVLLSGTDRRYAHTDATFLSIPAGSTIVHAPNNQVLPDTTGKPSIAEIKAWNDALGSPHTDTYLNYTGTNTSTDPTTYLFYVDANGVVELVEAPNDPSLRLRRRLVPSPVFALPESPTETEVLAWAQNLPGGLLPGTLLVQTDGALPFTQSANNPSSSWLFDGVNITRVKDFPRKVEIPGSAFVDTNNPTVSEVYTWMTANPTYNGNYWNVYLIGTGTFEAPDYVWHVAGDMNVARNDIFLIKRPATGSADGDGMFDATNQNGTWLVDTFTISDGTWAKLPDNQANVLKFAEGTNNYINISTTNGSELIAVGPAIGTFQSTAQTFFNGGAWRQIVTSFGIASNYNLAATDAVLDVATTAGSFSIILPPSPASGRTVRVSKRTATNTLTLDGNGMTINGVATIAITVQYDGYDLIYNGSEWRAYRFGNAVSAGGITKYSAGNGCTVRATGAGVTFTRTTSSVWTLNIPTGVELVGNTTINSTAGESATAALTINVVYASPGSNNTNTSNDMTDLDAPVVTTVKKVTPGVFPSTSASNNPSWTVTVPVSGTVRLDTSEFTEVGNGGGNATSVILQF